MGRNFLITALLLGCCLPALCQYTEARRMDSLKIEALKNQLPVLRDTARIEYLNSISEKFGFFRAIGGFTHRYDSMYYYASKANREAERIGYKYGVAYSLLNMAYSAGNKSQKDSNSKKYILQAIRLGEEIHSNKILGWAYYLLAGDVDDPSENWKKSIYYFQKSGDPREGEVSTWLCMFHLDKGEYEVGFDYCQKGLQLSRLNANTEWGRELVQWSLYNMAELYKASGDYETTMSYLRQARQFGKVHRLDWEMEDQIGQLFILMNQPDSAIYYFQRYKDTMPANNQSVVNMFLGEAYLLTEEYDKALKLFKGSVDDIKKKNLNLLRVRILFNMGKTYEGNRNYSVALKYAVEGLTIAKNENIRPLMIDGYELLSRIYHQLGKDGKAYLNLRQYTTLKDSVLNRQFLWRLNNYKKVAEDEKKKAAIELLNKDNEIKGEQLKQEILLRNFLFTGLIALILMSFFIFRTLKLKQRNEKLKRARLENEMKVQQMESQQQQAELRQQATQLEMQALRAQMSPHFIFNCLSSINRFILKHESEAASNYLTRFSRLIRLVLSNSKKPLISLEDELEMISLYIEMERLRFNNSFDFTINIKDEVDTSSISIPPLLLQPFAENAIWHGLMNKEGHGQLDMSFSSDESILTCTITDNGVGRQKAEAFKSKKDLKRKSLGLQITTDRLAKLNRESNHDTFFTVEDLYDEDGVAAGTKVILKIRLEYAIQEVSVEQNNYA